MSRAFVTVGLQFGDEGKGATVEYLCRKHTPDFVIRYSGGSQCGHNVQLPDGRRHTYSQFGCGTHLGIPTFLGPSVIINPAAMKREADALQKQFPEVFRELSPFDHLFIDPNCLVTTSLHMQVNRHLEMQRGRDRHGSCGHGIGAAREYWLTHGTDAIRAFDLLPENAYELDWKLYLMRERFRNKYDFELETPIQAIQKLSVVPEQCIRQLAFERLNTAVFEGAQGVLIDQRHGFAPYHTWSDVTVNAAVPLLHQMTDPEVTTIGCMRAYTTRHGPGPFPTEEGWLVSDPGNLENSWQGKPRYGCLDLVMLQYAASCMGCHIDEIAMNCIDHIGGPSVAPKVCSRYSWSEGQHELTEWPYGTNAVALFRAVPIIDYMSWFELLSWIKNKIAPVKIFGHGPTHEDRTQQLFIEG